jgi:hypothetical protein
MWEFFKEGKCDGNPSTMTSTLRVVIESVIMEMVFEYGFMEPHKINMRSFYIG